MRRHFTFPEYERSAMRIFPKNEGFFGFFQGFVRSWKIRGFQEPGRFL